MHNKRGLLLVFCTAIISGFSIFINKFSVSRIEPYTFTFVKNLAVALVLVAIILFTSERQMIKQLTKKQVLQLIFIGLIGGSIPFLLFFKGLSLTSAASGSFIHKTMFIFVALFAGVFLKERLGKRILIPTLILLVGSALLVKFTAFTFGQGELLVFGATLLWAAENVLSKYVLHSLSGTLVAAGRMVFGAIFILLFLLATNRTKLLAALTMQDVLWTLITSFILLLFVLTYYVGLKEIKVTTATAILLIGSPITTLLNLTGATTTLAITQLFGILLTIGGVALMVWFAEVDQKNELRQRAQLHTHNE